MYECKDKTLRFSFYLAIAFAALVIIGGSIVIGIAPNLVKGSRLTELPPLPANWTNKPDFLANPIVCGARYEDVSVIESFGLAFGGYDVERDHDVFEEQLRYFFGPRATSINYSVEHLANDIPMVIYTINETTVFGIRGMMAKRELAIEIQLLAHYYAVPVLLHLMPLSDLFVQTLLSFYAPFAYLFGTHFLWPDTPFNTVLESAERIYAERHLTNESSVLFVGMGVGGVLAKVLGMRTGHRGLGLISMPAVNREFAARYNFSDQETSFMTNVFNLHGLWGIGEESAGENLAISGPLTILDRDSPY
jgi:hypothetical protein